MKINRIHHVAYRCHDARETVEWYRKHLDMEFVLAIAEDRVPSTKAPDPYMHLFMDAGNGNILAFFELPTQLSQAQRSPSLRCRPGWLHCRLSSGAGRACGGPVYNDELWAGRRGERGRN